MSARKSRSGRGSGSLALVCGLVAVFAAAPDAGGAERVDGAVGIAVVDQSVSGSGNSFRTQSGLRDGFLLDDLLLRWQAPDEKLGRFELTASGFGGAEPAERARLELELDSPWTFELRYDRRRSFFDLAESDLGSRSDRWDITRLRGTMEWDGWKAATLSLDLRRYERDGFVRRPTLELNQLYPLGVDLDEQLSEAALRLETKDLPVKLLFEQAYASYERANRWSAQGTAPISGNSPNDFIGAQTLQNDQRDVPTSRLVATYQGKRIEVVGSGLYRPAELDAPNTSEKTFGLQGGAFGQVGFVDEVLGAADMDTTAGDLRVGIQLAPSWTLRLSGAYRDTSTDARLLGARLLRVTNVFGDAFDIPGALDERSDFDVTDQDTRLELEWRHKDLSLWAGGLTANREVRYQIGNAAAPFSVERDSDGLLLGFSYRPVAGVDVTAEYEHGTFDRFVFRTEPESVDRLTLKLRASVGGGWSVQAQGRLEDGDNPTSVAGRQHSSDALNLGLHWASRDSSKGFGIDAHQLDITTDTALVLPGGGPGRSLYDLSLSTLTANGYASLGRVDLSSDLSRLDDGGETWPLEAWTLRARIAIEVAAKTQITLFGERWDYDENRGNLDDYEVTRYGLGLRRSFD